MVSYNNNSTFVCTIKNVEMRNIELLKERAENMRMKPTFHEKKFKDRLELAGIFYNFQKVLGNYIVDFQIGNAIVEIDGASHYEADQAAYDKQRTSYLSGLGFSVIRVRNEHVVSFDMNRLKSKGRRIQPPRNKHRKPIEAPQNSPAKSQADIKQILERRKQQQRPIADKIEVSPEYIRVVNGKIVLSLPDTKHSNSSSKRDKPTKFEIKYKKGATYK